MNKEEVQQKALDALIKNESGTIVLSTGSGKSKVAIDYIKHLKPKKILITSPRTNLKDNWKKELEKWLFSSDMYATTESPIIWRNSEITIENIQTCYKWSEDKLSEYDLIIMDKTLSM